MCGFTAHYSICEFFFDFFSDRFIIQPRQLQEIITIGTELPARRDADHQHPLIAQTYAAMGVDLYRTQTVGDNARRISEAVGSALQRAEYWSSPQGGLGLPWISPPARRIADPRAWRSNFHPELLGHNRGSAIFFALTAAAPTEKPETPGVSRKGAIVIRKSGSTAQAFIIESQLLSSK